MCLCVCVYRIPALLQPCSPHHDRSLAHSSSFWGLPSRTLNMNPKKEPLWGLWEIIMLRVGLRIKFLILQLFTSLYGKLVQMPYTSTSVWICALLDPTWLSCTWLYSMRNGSQFSVPDSTFAQKHTYSKLLSWHLEGRHGWPLRVKG